MKALLIKYNSKYDQQIITEVDVMHYSTAFEKLRKIIALVTFYSDKYRYIDVDYDYINKEAAKYNLDCRINRETYTKKSSIKEMLPKLGITELFKYSYECDIRAVITVTCCDVYLGVKTDEYYIVCSDESHKELIDYRLKTCDVEDERRRQQGYHFDGSLSIY